MKGVFYIFAFLTVPASILLVQTPWKLGAQRKQMTLELSDSSADDRPAALKVLARGETVTVDLALDESLQNQLPSESLKEQMRDALLCTVVAASGLGEADIAVALARIPSVRGDGKGTTPGLEDGLARFCQVGQRRIVVLLPKQNQVCGKDALAYAVDEFRRVQRKPPAELLVFEYELRAERSLGVITCHQPLRGETVFTLEYGYREQCVEKEADLTAFSAQVEDVVYAERADKTEGVFILGGRKLAGRPVRGISPGQVASIIRLKQKWKQDVVAFRRQWTNRVDEYEDRWNRIEAEVTVHSAASSEGAGRPLRCATSASYK